MGLAQGFEMIPATHALLDQIDASCPAEKRSRRLDGFVHLDGALATLLEDLSELASVAYVETEYFGGVGTQAAAVFANGAPAFIQGETEQPGAISEALRVLGVIRGHYVDEFDAVGLGRYRQMDDWEE